VYRDRQRDVQDPDYARGVDRCVVSCVEGEGVGRGQRSNKGGGGTCLCS
jgi:hypothetical protein